MFFTIYDLFTSTYDLFVQSIQRRSLLEHTIHELKLFIWDFIPIVIISFCIHSFLSLLYAG